MYVLEEILALVEAPIYLAFILAEIFASHYFNRKVYDLKDTGVNVVFTTMNLSLDILLKGLNIAILHWLNQFAVIDWQKGIMYWLALLIAEDFMFYWLHWVDHRVRFFWAIHLTHHSSQKFNFTTGFRSSVFQPLYRVVYFMPLALLGFDGLDIILMYAITQFYGIFVHTEFVRNLGFLEWFMVTPSHHRVHHASNPRYLDRNIGMVFIIWDRLFGTFTPETEAPVYGLTVNVGSNNPFDHIGYEWKKMWADLQKPVSFRHKLMYILGPPGWSHDKSTLTSEELRKKMGIEV
jgi:sterol desaturase/sphingolipid hydroxylase (fatty acid hydroxylase superfamily)